MSKTENDLIFGHYLVAFVDVLGQRNKLAKLDALPTDDNGPNYDDFIKAVKDSIGAVEDLQNTASEYFNSFTNSKNNDSLKSLTAFSKLNNTEIKFQHFSDGLMFYVPLKMDENYSPTKGVFGALSACGALCLLGLAKESPVRIGVSIGVATELRENELYGKAIADAYELESSIAQYPRVVLSEEVSKYLLCFAITECNQGDFECQMTKHISQQCQNMLSRDSDGRLILNYLGDFFRNHVALDSEVYKLAKSFIDEQLQVHREKQNSKLAFRYKILQGYFNEHLGEV